MIWLPHFLQHDFKDQKINMKMWQLSACQAMQDAADNVSQDFMKARRLVSLRVSDSRCVCCVRPKRISTESEAPADLLSI